MQAITDKSEEGKAVSKLIEVSESLRRHMFEGEVTQSDYSKEIQNMQKQFVKNFGLWAYQTDAYEDFYSFFGVVEK